MVVQFRQENRLVLQHSARERCTDLHRAAGGKQRNAHLKLLV
jgi:hypothetical protein